MMFTERSGMVVMVCSVARVDVRLCTVHHANTSVKCTYTPLFYNITGVYRGIHFFLIFALKHKNQRTIGPVNAHLISWPIKAQNIQNLENIW